MYLCGASVDCPSMMAFATSAMDRITSVLATVMPAVYRDAGLHRLHIPLRQGLELLRSQGNRPNAFAMRVAVARLVDVTLLWFMENEGFGYAFRSHWEREIYPMCFWDSVLFRRMGLIGEPLEEEVLPPDDAEALLAEDSDEGTVVGEKELEQVEKKENEDEDDTPRIEKKQKDAEAEPGVTAKAGQLAEQELDSETTELPMDTPSRQRAAAG